MMNKKAIGILIVNICLCCGLIAELHWWRPNEVPLIKGCLDTGGIAMNENGKAIVLLGDKIFGSYNKNTNQWNFIKLNSNSEEVNLESIELQENVMEYCNESYSNNQRVVLNNYDRGFVVFRLTEGSDAGKIGCLSYLNDNWESLTVLSEGKGDMPIIAQSSYGGAIVIWINKEEKHEDCLMGAYYNGSEWVNQGYLFEDKSIKMHDNEAKLQLVMNEMDDAIVVGKAYNKEKNEENTRYIVVNYFDGIKNKWGEGEVLAEQSRDNIGLNIAMNDRGDVVTLWKSDQGLDVGMLNLSQYMLKNYCGIKNLTLADWTKDRIAQGENLYEPKIAVDDKGNGVALWLQGNAGMFSAYCNIMDKSWSGASLVDSKVVYASNIKANHNGIYAIWIGERASSQEHILGAFFDVNSKTWKSYQDLNLRETDNSFIEAIDSFSLSGNDHGMLMWYDLFKERLYYSLLGEGIDLFYVVSKKEQRRELLNKDKAQILKYKAQRRNQIASYGKKWEKFKRAK